MHTTKSFLAKGLVFIISRVQIGHPGGCGEAQLRISTGSDIFGPAKLDNSRYHFISFVAMSIICVCLPHSIRVVEHTTRKVFHRLHDLAKPFLGCLCEELASDVCS